MEPNDMTDLDRAHHELLFGVRRSVRYHMRRVSSLDGFHGFVIFMAFVLSLATIAILGTELAPGWKLLPAALTSLLVAVDLLIGSSRKARQHADLARRFIELERKMVVGQADMTDATIAEWKDQRLQIELKEAPILRVLDTLCHNELLRAMGYEPERYIPVRWWQRFFAQFIDLREDLLHRQT